MKYLYLILIITNLFSISFAQQLVTSQDTIFFYPPPDHWELVDSIYAINQGDEVLIIDSIISQNGYNYQLDILAKDTTIYYNLDIGLFPIYLEILPGDSTIFIFYDPDLCPFCKKSMSNDSFFQDSISIFSNSLYQRQFILYADGIGYTRIMDDFRINSFYRLYQNYPNPFNSHTAIKLMLGTSGYVSLTVYNSLGQKIEGLFSGKLSIGQHKFIFDGSTYSSGIYYYILRTEDQILTKKMLLIN